MTKAGAFRSIGLLKILSEIPQLKAELRARQAAGARIALVPTMGALHDGHMSLMRLAKTKAELVVASVFVNPTQFGPGEDLDRYPRDLEGDAEKLRAEGVDLLFAPTAETMYPEGFQTVVSVRQVSQGLCGASRPGHFDGVATVVLKLLMIVRPDVAIFGKKDYQQLALLKTLARDLALDTEILGAPLIREPSGLAYSSRNALLSPEERTKALALSAALKAMKAACGAGARDVNRLLAIGRERLSADGLEAEYLEVRRRSDLSPVETVREEVVGMVAVKVGKTRLIDNLEF